MEVVRLDVIPSRKYGKSINHHLISCNFATRFTSDLAGAYLSALPFSDQILHLSMIEIIHAYHSVE
jgi:hypothetical protein